MTEVLKALSAINYWEGKPHFDTGFFRGSYYKNLERALGNQLIKVVIGQRRSGKSYIIRQLIERLISDKKVDGRNIFYLNKEMYEFDDIRTAKDLSEIIKLYEATFRPGGKIYILIDEVQNIEEWEKMIVSLAQHSVKKYEVFITGSNSRLLSGELATLLSGRYILLEVFPFSYREFLEYKDLDNTKEHFIEYITTSGIPEIFNLPGNEIIHHYFQALKNTILLKDIMYRHKIRDYVLLEDIFLFLLHNVGNLTSVPAIIKYFKSRNRKADYTTISQYISYMQDAFVIHEAPRYYLKTKEVLSGERKYFVNDQGFRNYLYPHLIRDTGALLENVVYMHLRRAGYQIRTGYGENYEVDFYAEKNNDRRYIQVTYVMPDAGTIEREFGSLERIKDHLPKTVVSMDDLLIPNEKGIGHEHVWDYLMELCR